MPDDPNTDPFRPPEVPTEVHCLHCGQEYESYLIEWREETDREGKIQGFWCCPIPGCDGMGFGFDLLPTDPEYRDEHGGWVSDDEPDEEESVEFDEQAEKPADPRTRSSNNGSDRGRDNGWDDEVPF